MTTDRPTTPEAPFSAHEPPRDAALARSLRAAVGVPPVDDVDWPALAARIGAAVRAARPAPWWSYAERWQRRALPLALAAGLVGALTIWSTTSSTPIEVATAGGSADVVSAIVGGGSSTEAALSYARSVTSAVDISNGAPE